MVPTNEEILAQDGEPLTSAEHPLHPEHVKAVAVAITIADHVDPFTWSEGLGAAIPRGQKYQLWETRKAQAAAAIKASTEWTTSNVPTGINADNVVNETIEVREGETLREAIHRHDIERQLGKVTFAPLAGNYMGRKPGEAIEVKLLPGETIRDAVARLGL